MIELNAIGNLGKDCVVNQTNGISVINFNVAHTEKYLDRQGTTVQKTTWLECSYWTDKTAIAQYLKKGTQVYIKGKPEARLFQKNDGTSGVSLAIRISQIQLLGGKREDNSQQSSGSSYNTGNTNTSDINQGEPIDDLPF
jgi:single-strand DNA-binding protein